MPGIKVTVKTHEGTTAQYLNIETEYGQAKANIKTGSIYWGDDGFWCNWPKLKAQGLIDTKPLPNSYGAIDLLIKKEDVPPA